MQILNILYVRHIRKIIIVDYFLVLSVQDNETDIVYIYIINRIAMHNYLSNNGLNQKIYAV